MISNPGRNFIPTSARDKQVSGVLESLANERGVTLLNIALAYVLQKVPYVFPIIGGRTVEHLKGNVPALGLFLTDEEIETIESAYDFDHGFPHTFLSGTLFDHSKPRGAYGPGDVWLTKPSGPFDWVENSKPIRPSHS